MRIAYLADHPQHIATVAGWIFSQWGHLRPGMTLEHSIQEFSRRAVKTQIPLTAIALEGEEVIGCVSLKDEEAITRPGLFPWVGGAFVREDWRGKGVGEALLEALAGLAADFGCTELYLSASAASDYYEALGWELFEQIPSEGEMVKVLVRHLAPEDAAQD